MIPTGVPETETDKDYENICEMQLWRMSQRVSPVVQVVPRDFPTDIFRRYELRRPPSECSDGSSSSNDDDLIFTMD